MRYNIIFFLCLFYSCKPLPKADIKREAFMGLQLGCTPEELNTKINKLIDYGQLSRFEERLYCQKVELITGKPYYMAPIFDLNAGDTIISKIRILYGDNLFTLSANVKALEDGILPMKMNALEDNIRGVSSNAVVIAVRNELRNKYGKENDEGHTYGTRSIDSLIWKDINGVDITLLHYNETDRFSETIKVNACVILEYSFNEKLRKEIIKPTSIY